MVSDWVLHFWKGSRNAFKKNNFCRCLHFFPKQIFVSTLTAIFSVIYCARQLLFTIFIKFTQKSFRIQFHIGSYVFGRGYKNIFKKQFLPILKLFPKRIFTSTSTAIFSVICCAGQVLFYYCHKIQIKIFQNSFGLGQIFWKGQKAPFKKTIFADFYTFIELYLSYISAV